MQPLHTKQLKSCFVNTSRSQIASVTWPHDLDGLPWDDLDFLGWRDPKAPKRGYLVLPTDDGPVGVAMRTATSRAPRPGSSLCDLCRSGHPREDVVLFAAPRAGALGKQGNTVGTYVCADLACSLYVRGLRELRLPQGETVPADVRAARLRRRVADFVGRVRR